MARKKAITDYESFARYSQRAKETLLNAERALGGVDNATAHGLEKFAQMVKARALYYTPVDTRELYNSAFISRRGSLGKAVAARFQSLSQTVIVGFGKEGAAPYAVFVHEIPYQHASPTQWKFLEQAMKDLAPQLTTVVGQTLRRAMRTAPGRRSKR